MEQRARARGTVRTPGWGHRVARAAGSEFPCAGQTGGTHGEGADGPALTATRHEASRQKPPAHAPVPARAQRRKRPPGREEGGGLPALRPAPARGAGQSPRAVGPAPAAPRARPAAPPGR